VANCFILSFKAIARASKLDWQALSCTAHGTLDKVERSLEFTEIQVEAELTLADEALRSKAERLLEKAEASCLVTNSMKAQAHLSYQIKISG
jgi:organic hydroperoxide reductase OsmC/OhrA